MKSFLFAFLSVCVFLVSAADQSNEDLYPKYDYPGKSIPRDVSEYRAFQNHQSISAKETIVECLEQINEMGMEQFVSKVNSNKNAKPSKRNAEIDNNVKVLKRYGNDFILEAAEEYEHLVDIGKAVVALKSTLGNTGNKRKRL